MRVNGHAGQLQGGLLITEALQGVQHLTLQALQVLKGDIEEVAATAGRVQYPDMAELVVVLLDQSNGPGLVALAVQADGGSQHRLPIGPQRLDHGRQHQPLHVVAGRVVSAQVVTFPGVQGALQQGAEDGRFHIAPIGLAGLDQQLQLLFADRQRRGLREQAAVEAQ